MKDGDFRIRVTVDLSIVHDRDGETCQTPSRRECSGWLKFTLPEPDDEMGKNEIGDNIVGLLSEKFRDVEESFGMLMGDTSVRMFIPNRPFRAGTGNFHIHQDGGVCGPVRESMPHRTAGRLLSAQRSAEFGFEIDASDKDVDEIVDIICLKYGPRW